MNVKTDYQIDSEHTELIRRHYGCLLETMDVKDAGLIAKLYAMKVIDLRDKDELESIENSTCIIERLLSMLSRTSKAQWESFLLALDETGQRHLADTIRGKVTEIENIPGFYPFCFKQYKNTDSTD
jgi:hypothetical protein